MDPDRQHQLVAEPVGDTMTIGELARRTGVAVKQLRRYEDLGFIYTVGRSAGNYRLFDESALWCVDVVTTWRSVGLTLDEIGDLVGVYLERPEAKIGPRLAERLRAARARAIARIEEDQRLLERIDAFETTYAAALAGETDLRDSDPRFRRDRP